MKRRSCEILIVFNFNRTVVNLNLNKLDFLDPTVQILLGQQ